MKPEVLPCCQNHAHLLLIIDQEGSMTPFHPFVRDIVNTVQESSIKVETFYFHNTPVEYLYQDYDLVNQNNEVIPHYALIRRYLLSRQHRV